MPKTASFISIGTITLDRAVSMPLHRQLYQALKEAILEGQLTPGTRLPSTRALAQELGVSRNTVVDAFDQLIAEGYLESQVGSGTHVTHTLPEKLLYVNKRGNGHNLVFQAKDAPVSQLPLSERGMNMAQVTFKPAMQPRPFCPGLPAIDAFPFKVWEKLLVKSWRTAPVSQLGYGVGTGYRPLREAIADYLRQARGVRCTGGQVLITNGAQQALTLAATVLLNKGDAAWIESPCYRGFRAALLNVSAQIIPVSVDNDGLVISEALDKAPNARLAVISPSHQYPLGVTMSLTRRLQLLQWAQETGAWILEDDYDSAFRFAGYPLASLQGLDKAGQVIYIGTFSKTLFPALRLGYMVVPSDLIEPIRIARAHADRGSSLMEQVVVTHFINDGHFARHIRRMRLLYAQRQAVFVKAVQTHLPGLLELQLSDSGLHMVGWLPAGVDDQYVVQKLLEKNIDTHSLSQHSITPLPRGGLIMGYASVAEDDIVAAVKQMKPVLSECMAQL